MHSCFAPSRRSASRCKIVPVTVVILAAGESKRFGSQKLVHVLPEGDTLLSRAIAARGTHEAVVVTSSALREHAASLGARVVVNDEPARGMSHSLRLANAAIDATHKLAVLPADLVLIDAARVDEIVAEAARSDVTYPMRGDATPGHPVVFSTRARAYIEELRDNEPIARVREHQDLTRSTIAIEAAWPYRDVDTPGDL